MAARIDPSWRRHLLDEADRRRVATAQEAIAALGEAESARINYVPQMLAAVAIDAALSLCERAKEMRLTETKPMTRMIKKVCDAWARALSAAMSQEAIEAYNICIQSFADHTETQRWIAFQKLKVDAANKGSKDPEASAWCAWFDMLRRECRAFEDKMERDFPKFVNVQMRAALRIVLANIAAEIDRIKALGYDMAPTPQALPAPGVIRNAAWDMCNLMAKK